MTHEKAQEELSLIKNMIEKTRRETTESGTFFITIGIFSIIASMGIGLLIHFNQNHLIFPSIIGMFVICGILGYVTVTKSESKDKVKSYHKKLLYKVLSGITVPAILVMFVFPLLKVYPWDVLPIILSLLIGILVYSTGAILESRYILWSASVWWIGALILVFISGLPRLYIMMALMLIGWIIPGVVLNHQYRNRGQNHAA